MVKDGFYKVNFSAASPGAGGIVIVDGDKIRGGDEQYLYSGSLTTQGTSLTASIRVSAYVPGATTVFNTKDTLFKLDLTGTVNGDDFHLSGQYIPGRPPITISGIRIAELSL